MKKEEKRRKNREHILDCAFAEFARHGYMGASVNTMCADNNISKGLLYYYFADKDEMYLACARRCFAELTGYLSGRLDAGNVTPDLYFDVRLVFFETHPLHQRLFFDCVVNPPEHLRGKISDCRGNFDRLNSELLTAILEKETLAEDINFRDAVEQLRIFEDYISCRLKISGQEAQQAKEHNELCRRCFRTMLYGLIAR